MPLAIQGGSPVRKTPITYGHQYIDEADCEAVRQVLLGDMLTCGPQIPALEARLSALTGARHALAIANGTAALHAAAHAAGIGPGDEAITTPITFAATANCVLYCGGTPVFADIDPHTYNIDPRSVAEKITERTKAVIAVDYTGQAAKLDALGALCKAHNLLLIEDASHAIGTRFDQAPIGSIADLTTFSFHPVKTVTGGEGGAVLTNDASLHEALTLFRAHGITRDPDLMENPPEGPWQYDQISLGYNYRLTDIQAALILSQLDKLDRFATRRKEIVQRYDEAFSQMPALFVQQEIPQSDTVRHLYILRLKPESLRATRREIYDALAAENVICNVHYLPVYWLSYYQHLGYPKGLCPHAEALYENMLTIPLYYGMSDEDVESVIEAVQKVITYYMR